MTKPISLEDAIAFHRNEEGWIDHTLERVRDGEILSIEVQALQALAALECRLGWVGVKWCNDPDRSLTIEEFCVPCGCRRILGLAS